MMTKDTQKQDQKHQTTPPKAQDKTGKDEAGKPVERGGPKGPEPTRFGDWESGGRCTDF